MTKSQAVTPKIKRNELRTGALSTMIEAETQAQRVSHFDLYKTQAQRDSYLYLYKLKHMHRELVT